jgi:hypothetical protein
VRESNVAAYAPPIGFEGEVPVSLRNQDREFKDAAEEVAIYSEPACERSSAGCTLMRSLSHLICLPDSLGRPPGNVRSSKSISDISFAFIRIQFGRGRLLEPWA